MNKGEIETARLVVRRFRAGDWKDLHEYLSDPEVVRFEPFRTDTKGNPLRQDTFVYGMPYDDWRKDGWRATSFSSGCRGRGRAPWASCWLKPWA